MMYRKVKEVYRGYEIVLNANTSYYTQYYCIFKDKVQISSTCLSSIQAAKNVIDTHERALAEQLKYEQA